MESNLNKMSIEYLDLKNKKYSISIADQIKKTSWKLNF